MTAIILAFIAGVIVGIVYMRIKYGARLDKLNREFQELKTRGAVLEGQYEILRTIAFGSEKGDSEDVLP